jgi:hypothetical protein
VAHEVDELTREQLHRRMSGVQSTTNGMPVAMRRAEERTGGGG